MEIDSPYSPRDDLSPRDRIIQRLTLNGVPEEYLEDLPSSLVAFARYDKDYMSNLVLAMLPTDTEVVQLMAEAKAKSTRSQLNSSVQGLFYESMAFLQWLIFQGNPQHALDNISKAIGERGICGTVWETDDMAFRCRTCENDSTCAICIPCFQNGNHKDHDYSIIHTNGGCCDCGDVTAWKQDGFCSKHVGAGSLRSLPHNIAESVGPVLHCLFDCWKSKLVAVETLSTESTKSDDLSVGLRKVADELTSSIVEMLLEFCKHSESLLTFVSKKVIAVVGLLDILVRAERYMTGAVMKKLHKLLLKLLGDPVFKLEFAKVFVNHYPSRVSDAVTASSGTIRRRYHFDCALSVQIFTVPTLAMCLVKERNLLAVLMQCLGYIFVSCSGEDALLQLSKWGHMAAITISVIEDIKYILSNPEVVEYITSEQQHIFKVWLRILSLVQGMNPQIRETGIHIEEENDSIHLPFTLCHSIATINSLLVVGACSAAASKKICQPPSDLYKQDASDELGQMQTEIVEIVSDKNYQGASEGVTECEKLLQDFEAEPSYASLAFECLRVMDQWFGSESTSSSSNGVAHSCTDKSNANFSSFKEALSRIRQGKYHVRLYEMPYNTRLQIKHDRGKYSESDMDVDDSGDCSLDDDNILDEDSATESGSLQMLSMSAWQTINYDVSSQEISVHMPLHGLLSLILKEVLVKFYGDSLMTVAPGFQDTIFPDEKNIIGKILKGCHPFGFSSCMMEHPLRIRVFCAQVHAGMWKKNGETALVSSEYYCTARRSPLILELDLFLLQICGASAPSDLYVRRILDRFGLLNYLSLDLEQSSEYEPVLVKEMLALIIQIVKERRYCGLTASENLQRELIRKLATGDATRSQLQNSLSRDLSRLNELQEVLDRIAQYLHPSRMQQGRYSMRLSYWKELDLYHPCWNPRTLQEAEEKYLRNCGVSALTTQLPKWTKIYQPLSGIARIATCKTVLHIVRAIVFYAVSDKSVQSRAPEEVLITGLHLLALGLDICMAQRDSGLLFEHRELIPLISFADEEINTGSPDGSDQQSLLSLLVLLMRLYKNDGLGSSVGAGNLKLSSLVESLLKTFVELDSECRCKLQQLAPEIFYDLSQPWQNNDDKVQDSASVSENRKAKVRERQAAILAKMRAEQSKFLQSAKNVANSELDGYQKEAQASHVGEGSLEIKHELCSLCHDSGSKDPLSFPVFLQKSRLVSFLNRGSPSWEQDWWSREEKGPAVPDTLESSSGLGAVSTESSMQVLPLSQMTPLFQETVGQFSSGAHPIEVKAFIDSVTARIPELMNVPLPCISSETRGKIVYSLESLENNMFTAIQKELDIFASDSVMMEGQISAGKDTQKVVDIDTILLGKYVASFTTEPAKLPSVSNDSRTPNEYTLENFDGFGPADCDGIHLSSCGHAVHQICFDRYLSSLRDRHNRRLLIEGGHIVDPQQGEFLCPVCRRLANSVMPADHLDAHDLQKKQTPTSTSSLDRACSLAAPNQRNKFRLQYALCLLRSVSSLLSKGEIIDALPIWNGRMLSELEPLFGVLCGLYFPGKKVGLSSASRVSPSLVLWDTLKYSLVSTEIAIRHDSYAMPDSGLCALSGSISSSGGFILSSLLSLVQSLKTSNSLDVLLRLRGIRLFTASICHGSFSDEYLTYTASQEEKILRILEYIDAGVSCPDRQFWYRASDSVLSRDPFSTLMWILFCLPHPFLSHRESFLSLVHMFYAVSVIQGTILSCVKHGCPTIDLGFDDCLVTDIYKFVARSAIAHQYFLSNYVNSSFNFKDTVCSLSLPFLRRCALLWKLINSSASVPLDADCGNNSSSFDRDQLCSMFEIPPLDLILADTQLRSLGIKWFHHFEKKFVRHPLYLTPAVPFQLMRLPFIYQDLLQRYIKPRCPYCREVQLEAALCLFCGRLCSASWKPCCSQSGCQFHAKSCGSGTGVFLLTRSTSILLQRNARRTLWPSPYLDAYGEEDLDMQRGKPLYLNEERYSSLNYMVASHGLDWNSMVLRQTTVGTFFVVD